MAVLERVPPSVNNVNVVAEVAPANLTPVTPTPVTEPETANDTPAPEVNTTEPRPKKQRRK